MRIVSNTPNIKRARYGAARRIDPNLKGEALFRAQEKNSYNVWVDVSPLFTESEINKWLDGKGLELKHPMKSGFQVSIPVEKKAPEPCLTHDEHYDSLWLHDLLNSVRARENVCKYAHL